MGQHFINKNRCVVSDINLFESHGGDFGCWGKKGGGVRREGREEGGWKKEEWKGKRRG